MLNSEHVSKLHKLNRAIDNATYDLINERKKEHDRLQELIADKATSEVLKVVKKYGPDYPGLEFMIKIAVNEAISNSQNVSDYLK